MRYQQAFTLLEMTIVVAIISILAMISIPFMYNYMDEARGTSAVSDIERIAKNIILYHAETGQYPNSLADVYMEDLTDPWGNPYQYLNISTAKGKGELRKDRNLVPINSDYDLYSMGPDGKTAGPLTASSSRDDIVRASNGSYIGIAADY